MKFTVAKQSRKYVTFSELAVGDFFIQANQELEEHNLKRKISDSRYFYFDCGKTYISSDLTSGKLRKIDVEMIVSFAE